MAGTGNFYNKDLQGVYAALGGEQTFRKVSEAFHAMVEEDALLREIFPHNMAALEERLALFLIEFCGGDGVYTAARGKNSLVCRHAHLKIGSAEASRWLQLLTKALAATDCGGDEQAKKRLLASLHSTAESLADPLMEFYTLPLEALKQQIAANPSLATANFHGRNLLCKAAIDRDAARVRLLLEMGADVHITDTSDHTPLYRCADGKENQHQICDCIRVLLEYGAKVNMQTGVQACTALHMAARRGNTEAARLLLEAGALVDLPDKAGETPLRRAVNCGSLEVARLLVKQGANPNSRDKKGTTPLSACRDNAMRAALGAAPI